ncbi:mitochondrial carrier domain-containing protein [Hyaloraphidium curvatum]|nr:mitochondrial carrier domain-containing protein [Hyaloraphidium curvatum]
MSKLTPFGNAVAGALGAATANTIIYPLDVVKTRLSVQTKHAQYHGHVHYAGTFDAFAKIFEQEGVAGLYAGIASTLGNTVAQNFAYFYWYGFIRGWWQKRNPGNISTVMELLLGALAGAFSQMFTLPLAVISTRQQTASKRDKKSVLGTFWEIVNDEGWPALWKGLKASLVLCSNPAITYGMFERMKSLLLEARPRKGNSLSPLESFMLGALSKTMATVVTYPYIMAKVKLQWKPPKELANDPMYQYKGALDVLAKVYKQDGISGWYRGMDKQITKGVLSQAILFTTKDQYTFAVIALYALAQRVFQKPVAAKQA